jgi:hypothetical protein
MYFRGCANSANSLLSTSLQAEALRAAIGVSNIGGNVIINGNGLP